MVVLFCAVKTVEGDFRFWWTVSPNVGQTNKGYPNRIGVSSWDYDSYHIGDQRRLRRACASAQSRQSFHCSHTGSMEVDEGSDKKSDIFPHWMAALVRLKNDFTEDEKNHNLVSWLIFRCWSEYDNGELSTSGLLKAVSGIYLPLVATNIDNE